MLTLRGAKTSHLNWDGLVKEDEIVTARSTTTAHLRKEKETEKKTDRETKEKEKVTGRDKKRRGHRRRR